MIESLLNLYYQFLQSSEKDERKGYFQWLDGSVTVEYEDKTLVLLDCIVPQKFLREKRIGENQFQCVDPKHLRNNKGVYGLRVRFSDVRTARNYIHQWWSLEVERETSRTS